MMELKNTEISSVNGTWQEAEELLQLIRGLGENDEGKEKLLELLRKAEFASDFSPNETKTA